MSSSAASGLDFEHERWDPRVRRHHRKLVVYLIARGVPARDAEDIANEAWLVLWRKRGRLEIEDEAGFIALAKRQAWFIALDRFRAPKEESATPNQDEQPDPAAEETEPGAASTSTNALEALEQAERRRLLAEAILTLPAGWQRVLHLAYFEEREHKEIAEALFISVQRVREIIQDAKARLRTTHRGLFDAIDA